MKVGTVYVEMGLSAVPAGVDALEPDPTGGPQRSGRIPTIDECKAHLAGKRVMIPA